MTADLLAEVCHDVSIEPGLNELSGENFAYATANTKPEARLDISAQSFFMEGCFTLTLEGTKPKSLKQAYVTNEKENKR